MTIDEMRKRLDCCTWYEGYGLDEDDIRDLLSRVERYEKALKEIVANTNCYVCEAEEWAKEALKEE